MDNPFKSPAILSLCTGMRGLERGIERTIGELNIISYVEIEAFIIQNLVAQMEQGVLAPTPVWSNLKTFPSQSFHRKVHGIIGGYPCQPFSVAGKQRGTEDPRHLWPYIKEMVRTVEPIWCFFENVPGHINLGYREVRRDLEELGYKVEEGIFSAEEVGAPHQRKRLFILAIRRGVDLFNSSGWWSGGLRDEISEREGHGASGPSGILDNASSVNGRDARRQESHESKFNGVSDNGDPASEKLAHSDSIGHAHREFKVNPTERRVDALGNTSASNKDELANTNISRSGKDSKSSELRTESIEQPSFDSWESEKGKDNQRRFNRWPSRPGQPQHEWEEPRIKSRMGFTVNGYNYREDLLRMAGNGVVEQTAELAFRTLLTKHIESWNT